MKYRHLIKKAVLLGMTAALGAGFAMANQHGDQIAQTQQSKENGNGNKAKQVSESCPFHLVGGIDGYMKMGGKRVPYTLSVSPSIVGTYQHRQSGNMSFYSGGTAKRSSGSGEIQWGISLSDSGKLLCKGGSIVVMEDYGPSESNDYFTAKVIDGRVCWNNYMYQCK